MVKTMFNPVNTPVTPYIRRLRKELNLTQSELAREAQTTQLAVLRNEHLNYNTPLPNIATRLSQLSDIPLKHIQTEYHIDVQKRRQWTASMLASISTDLLDYYCFKTWRIAICKNAGLPTSIIKFSSMVCVNPNTISSFEKRNSANGLTKPTSIPRSLAVAFREMGYPNSFLLDLAHANSKVNYEFD